MKAAFCPICDQKMKRKHFCSNCRAYVMKPVIMEDYTNRNTQETVNDKTVYKKENVPIKTSTLPTARKYRRLFIGMLLIIYFIFGVLMPIIRSIESDDWSDGKTDDFRYNEGYYQEDNSSNRYTEEEITLLKDTVIKDYDECDGLKHMDIKADEFIKVLDSYMEGKMPLTTIDEYDNLKLVHRTYEDNETEDNTYFHSYVDTYFSDEIYLGYYIDYDTASYRIHMFETESEDKETLLEIIRMFIDATGEELLYVDESLEDFFVCNEGGDYTSLYRGDYWLYFSTYEYEGGFSYFFSAELY